MQIMEGGGTRGTTSDVSHGQAFGCQHRMAGFGIGAELLGVERATAKMGVKFGNR
ncbi:MAG: hypothetical protein ACF788_04180 [Novipirellula sp. JB048]